jgi:hypothetical protein
MIMAKRKVFVHSALPGQENALKNNTNFQKVLKECLDFVNQLGYEKVMNVCEYTVSARKFGDDGHTLFAVWYWDDVEDE